MNKLIWLATLSFALTLTACKKSESDDIARAQDCLDNVPESNPDKALECLTYVEKYSSQQANILLCSIYITSGGLMETKIAKGYTILKDSTQGSQSASFMTLLALDFPNVDAGYTKAVSAKTYCDASGVPGLKYLGNIVMAGSYMAKTMAHIPGGGAIDINDPASVDTAVQNLLNQCAPASPATPDPSCATDIAQLGDTVVTIADSYCSSSSADASVCDQIDSAVESAGGASAAVGQALLCYLSNKTYDINDGLCH